MEKKNSSVTIKGLTRIQANGLALLCEGSDIGDLINEHLDRLDLQEELLGETTPNVIFDDSDEAVDHVVDFDY